MAKKAMKNPRDLEPASPISILEGLKLNTRYARRQGIKTRVSSIALLSNNVPAIDAAANVVRTDMADREPDRPSIPSVALVALMDTIKRITARI